MLRKMKRDKYRPVKTMPSVLSENTRMGLRHACEMERGREQARGNIGLRLGV